MCVCCKVLLLLLCISCGARRRSLCSPLSWSSCSRAGLAATAARIEDLLALLLLLLIVAAVKQEWALRAACTPCGGWKKEVWATVAPANTAPTTFKHYRHKKHVCMKRC